MRHTLYFLILISQGCASSNDKSPASFLNANRSVATSSGETTQVPATESKTVVVDHGYFTIAYDPSVRLAQYVTYTATKEDLCKSVGDRNRSKFHSDKKLADLNLPFVAPSEYKRTGYDQGHLAPAGDFTRSQSAVDTTFVMSNMAPQKPKLNRVAWRVMEAKVRNWGIHEKKITVITGPIFDDNMAKLRSGLAIPNLFFKIVIDESPPQKAIAFIYKQTDAKANVLPNRVAKIAEIEQATNLDFGIDLPDSDLGEWQEGRCSRRN